MLIETLHGRFLQTVDITPEEVRAYFDSTRTADSTAFTMPERVDMMVIANPDEAKVRDALKRIARGEPEAKVIEQSSRHCARAATAGDRVPWRWGRTRRPSRTSVHGTGASKIIPTEGMFFAIKVLMHERQRPATYEEVQPKLTQQMAQSRGEKAFDDWLNKDRETRGVEIFDDALELIGQAVSGPGSSAADSGAGK